MACSRRARVSALYRSHSAFFGCLFACLILTLPSVASAQTAQRFSAQISGLGNSLFGDDFIGLKTGFGVEGQVRYNPSAFSIGAGIQFTSHGIDFDAVGIVPTPGLDLSTTLTGFFVEPRYVFDMGSDKAAPYVSARASVSNLTVKASFQGVSDSITDTGVTVNAGGGVLYRMGARTNLDFGATYGYKRLGVISDGADTGEGSGTNLIFRVGFAFGLGG